MSIFKSPRILRTPTIRRTFDDVAEMQESLCYGRDVTAHLSVIGMTIIRGR